MKIFLSYAPKDTLLAEELTKRLTRADFDVFNPDEQIEPGDNWAKKIGDALDHSDVMVILLTPGAMKFDGLRRNIQFAISARKYENRVFTLYVGPTLQIGKDAPWVLLKQPHFQIESLKGIAAAVKKIQAHFAAPAASRSHA